MDDHEEKPTIKWSEETFPQYEEEEKKVANKRPIKIDIGEKKVENIGEC